MVRIFMDQKLDFLAWSAFETETPLHTGTFDPKLNYAPYCAISTCHLCHDSYFYVVVQSMIIIDSDCVHYALAGFLYSICLCICL